MQTEKQWILFMDSNGFGDGIMYYTIEPYPNWTSKIEDATPFTKDDAEKILMATGNKTCKVIMDIHPRFRYA